MAVKRRCADCPPWTQTVCRHAFAAFWNAKSGNGEGCDYPLDGVAEAWRKAGWTHPSSDRLRGSLRSGDMEQGVTKRLTLPLPTRPMQREFKLTSLVEKYKKGLKK